VSVIAKTPQIRLCTGACQRQFFRRVLHGLDDVLVARAAAQIARHPVPDLLFRGTGIFLEQPVGARDHTRRAETALQTMLSRKPFLDCMQGAALFESLDREHLGALTLYGEQGAGLDRHAVEIDRACAAMRGLATDMRTGMLEPLAQRVDEQLTRLDHHIDFGAVQLERYCLFLRHLLCPPRCRLSGLRAHVPCAAPAESFRRSWR